MLLNLSLFEQVLFRVMGKARGEIDKYDLYLHDRREASKEGTNMGFQSDFPHDTCDRQISSSVMLLSSCGHRRTVINSDDCSHKVFSNSDNTIDLLDLSTTGNLENYVLKISPFE